MNGTLEVKDLTKTFPAKRGGDTVALEDIDLHVERGRVRLHRRCVRAAASRPCSASSPGCWSRPRAKCCSTASRSKVRGRTVASCSRTTRCTRGAPSAENIAFGLELAGIDKHEIERRVDALPRGDEADEVGESAARASSPAACASAWPSRVRWPPSQRCCCWTSRSARSTRRRSADARVPALGLARNRHDGPDGHARRRRGALPGAARLRPVVAPRASEARDRGALRRANAAQRCAATNASWTCETRFEACCWWRQCMQRKSKRWSSSQV